MRFDQFDFDADDGCIATEKDITHGVGSFTHLIDLQKFNFEGWKVNDMGTLEGKCPMCGYDRGILEGHTEVPNGEVTCRNCDFTLAIKE